MKPVKVPVLITISLVVFTASQAQLKLPASNPIQNDIGKVLKDYPNQFRNLIAEELSNNFQSTDYRSTIVITGAEECSVTKYNAKKKAIYSWQALMLTTDDFETAKKKFKTLYGQLNNLSVQLASTLPAQFKGNYESPSEAKNFTSSIFSAVPSSEAVKNLKIELTMQYELMQWKIRILVYAKEREDDERGETKEG
jgi:hypothetical protein